MTGYGKAVATYKNKKISVEIKTLNSKTLDLNVRVPLNYREKEMEIRQRIAKALERGKADLSIWTETDASAAATPINGALVAEYYKQVTGIANDNGIKVPDDILCTLLRMPDVMVKQESNETDDEEWQAVSQALDEAIDKLISFRKQEGEALEKKFKEKIDNIESLLNQIEPYEKARVEKIKARIIEGLKEIPDVEYDKNRLEQELIYYIEKLDISEEKQRLQNHLNYFRTTMAEEHSQGKKLGFIAQEMGREINTTGSKSNMAEMQNIVVKMKDELEQIKEQVLNAL